MVTGITAWIKVERSQVSVKENVELHEKTQLIECDELIEFNEKGGFDEKSELIELSKKRERGQASEESEKSFPRFTVTVKSVDPKRKRFFSFLACTTSKCSLKGTSDRFFTVNPRSKRFDFDFEHHTGHLWTKCVDASAFLPPARYQILQDIFFKAKEEPLPTFWSTCIYLPPESEYAPTDREGFKLGSLRFTVNTWTPPIVMFETKRDEANCTNTLTTELSIIKGDVQ